MNDTTTDGSTLLGDIKLAWNLLRDPESPMYLKALPLLAGLYFIMPEGFAAWPLATPLDDVAVFYAALKGVLRMAPPHLVAKYTGDASLNYVDGEYEVVEDAQEKDVAEDIVINPDKHDW